MQKQVIDKNDNEIILVYKIKNGEMLTPEKINNDLKLTQNDIHLTGRETEVLKHLVNGESNVEIADKLFISVHTAKAHVSNIMQKMGVKDRVCAAVYAVKRNIV